MKHQKFYKKYKTSQSPAINPFFFKNSWSILLTTAIAVGIEPLIILYKNQRLGHFSFHVYFQVLEYLLMIVVPFLGFLLWTNWRDWLKRSSGYVWLGKFEVISKQASFAFCYLLLVPGDDHRLRVERELYDKIRVGDHIQIRRNALGGLEEISRVRHYPSRLNKTMKRSSSSDPTRSQRFGVSGRG